MDQVATSQSSIQLPENYGMLVMNIINVVSRRGGITPDEFKVVGEVYEYLKKELKVEEKLEQQKLEQQKLEQQQLEQENEIVN